MSIVGSSSSSRIRRPVLKKRSTTRTAATAIRNVNSNGHDKTAEAAAPAIRATHTHTHTHTRTYNNTIFSQPHDQQYRNICSITATAVYPLWWLTGSLAPSFLPKLLGPLRCQRACAKRRNAASCQRMSLTSTREPASSEQSRYGQVPFATVSTETHRSRQAQAAEPVLTCPIGQSPVGL